MSDTRPAWRPRIRFDGRLNLEQQRKRAKELLKSLRDGEPEAQRRFTEFHPEFSEQSTVGVKLADAQLVVARENGFPSWPRMKAHIDTLALARKRMDEGAASAPDTEGTLHIRCGSDIRHGLQIAGFVGPFLEFADPYCQGPVPDLPLDEFIRARAGFVADAYGLDPRDSIARAQREYGRLAAIGDHERIVLWFEHDSYDQLILAFLFDFLGAVFSLPPVELICVDRVPGVPDFIGLGEVSPEVLLWLWDNARVPLTPAHATLGRRVWPALRNPDPRGLLAIAEEGTEPVPFMANALLRQLRELPSTVNGLGLTQQLGLQIIADEGPVNAGRVFGRLMTAYEPLPFLGDLMFWHVLVDLGDVTDPLFAIDPETAGNRWPQRTLSITDNGRRVLDGEVDFFDLYRGTRWVGGVELTAGKPSPRWDEGAQAIA